MQRRALPPTATEPDLTGRTREIRLPARAGGYEKREEREVRT